MHLGHGVGLGGHGDEARDVAHTPVPTGQREEARGHGYDDERRRPESLPMADGDARLEKKNREGGSLQQLTGNTMKGTAGLGRSCGRRISRRSWRRPTANP